MAGGIIQLVARGVEDIYLTYNPEITYFKIIYKRHTNFACESIIQNFASVPNFGDTSSCIISRSGDLVDDMIMYIELPALPKFTDEYGNYDDNKKIAWVKYIGYAIIKDIFIEIGGKMISKHYGEWLYIWSEMSDTKQYGLDKMVGNVPELYEFSNGKDSYQLFIPLKFWFCQKSGLALPLIALGSTDVKVTVSFNKLSECIRIGPTHSIVIKEDIVPFKMGDYIKQTSDGNTIYGYVIEYDYIQKKLYYMKLSGEKKTFDDKQKIYGNDNFFCTPISNEVPEITQLPYLPRIVNAYLYIGYVYIDTDEREKFIKTTHEYLIEQLQFNQELKLSSPNVKQQLSLKHPCKSHYWVLQLDSLVGAGTINDRFNYTMAHISDEPILQTSKLVLNDNDRFTERNEKYFNNVQPYEHHSNSPSKGIYVYSPSEFPEDPQPYSTINMSLIENIYMDMKLNSAINKTNLVNVRGYTVNNNVLRICFQMGAVVFN